jgi:hypothetical protein
MGKTEASIGNVRIDRDFPGGNILVDRLEEGLAVLRQDQRDTAQWWFHWAFRIRGAAGREWRFEFAGGDVIGTRGPAVSLDGGQTWVWLGREIVSTTPAGAAFSYRFPENAGEARFAFAMPYLQTNLAEFLARQPMIERHVLCHSRQNREVELLRLPCRAPEPKWRIVMAARHHCCESVADWVLEGILEAALAPTADGAWWRQNAEFLAVPFVDKDGVENGDQGKGRHPFDHGRDYADGRDPIYPETAALASRLTEWAAAIPTIALDLHCPWIRGEWSERVYMVGGPLPETARSQARLANLLAATDRSGWDYRTDDLLAHGQGWNIASNYSSGKSFARFASEQPGIAFATTFEIPYANVRGKTVCPDGARAFGHSLATALRIFADTSGDQA